MENNFEHSEWELINPKNISFVLNNHDGLLWELLVNLNLRGMPIGSIVQEGNCFNFETNKLDQEYSYRMLMRDRNVLFFRKLKSDF